MSVGQEPAWVEPELPDMPQAVVGHEPDHRPNVYQDGSRLVFRASSLGHCDKSLIAAGLGEEGSEPPASIRGKWDESQGLEAEVIRQGLEWAHEVLGMKAKLLQPNIRADAAGLGNLKPMGGQWGFDLTLPSDVAIRGHLDGAALVYESKEGWSPGAKRFVIEAKAYGDDYWDAYRNNPDSPKFVDNWVQWDLYRYMSGLPGLYIVGHKQKGKIIDVSCKWHEYPVNEQRITDLAMRAMALTKQIRAGELPETCSRTMWPCPFWWMHEGVEVEQLDEIEDAELEQMLTNYAEWQVLLKNAQTETKDLKQAIAERVGSKKAKVGKWRVNVYHSEYPAKTVERKAYSSTTVKVEALEETG